ncbi:MAG: glycosyltransferase family 4 protein [Saprospiraceae bacterium]
MPTATKILHVENSTWDVYNFRLPHIRKLQAQGYEVIVVSPIDDYFGYLNEQHFSRHIPLKYLRAQKKNPLYDLLFLWELIKIYRQERPSLVIHFTIKPNIYGSIAARLTGTPAISVFTGLGYAFLHSKGFFRFIPWLCKVAFYKLQKLILYNEEDLRVMVDKKIIPLKSCAILHGSGVNTNHYRPLLPKARGKAFTFLFIGRLLYDKGLAELVKAIRALQEMGKDVECWVVGDFTYTNPSAVSKQQLHEWVRQRYIRYFGATDDVRQFIRNVDVVVLPAFGGEGVPKVLLESMSMGKPILTTTTPGCKDTVVHGRNGLVVPPKDQGALKEAMLYYVELPGYELAKMGEASRELAILKFDDKIITAQYLEIIRSIIQKPDSMVKNRIKTLQPTL